MTEGKEGTREEEKEEKGPMGEGRETGRGRKGGGTERARRRNMRDKKKKKKEYETKRKKIGGRLRKMEKGKLMGETEEWNFNGRNLTKK